VASQASNSGSSSSAATGSADGERDDLAPPDAQLLAAFEQGDERAADILFQRYYRRLLRLVAAKRGWMLKQSESSSDVVQSVFHAVFAYGRAGKIQLENDKQLWPLLVKIALHKIYDHAKHLNRQSRDPKRQASIEISNLLSQGPAPESALVLTELIDELVAAFPERRQAIVLMLLQGEDVPIISRAVGVSERTVYHTRAAVAQVLKAAAKPDA